MASIVSQEQDADHLSLTGSTGRSITITRQEICDYYTASVSDDRQSDAEVWIKNRIVAELGTDVISVSEIVVTVDPFSACAITMLAIGSA